MLGFRDTPGGPYQLKSSIHFDASRRLRSIRELTLVESGWIEKTAECAIRETTGHRVKTL
jgi:hypothetical protein